MANHGKRTKNFSKEEDIALCKAWIHISEDPFQNKACFWERIYDEFDKLSNGNPNKRSLDSVTSKWQKIMPEISKFCANLNREMAANPPGKKAVHDTYYKFYHCYKVLVESSKWNDLVNARSGTITPANKKQKSNSEPKFTGGASNDTPSSMRNINADDHAEEVSPMASHTQGDIPNQTPVLGTQNPIPPNVFLNIGDGEIGGRITDKERRRQSSSSNSELNYVQDYSNYLSKAHEAMVEELAIKKAHLELKQRMWESMEIERRRCVEERQQRLKDKKREKEEDRVWEESRIMMVDPDKITDPIRKAYFVNLQRDIFNRSLQVSK